MNAVLASPTRRSMRALLVCCAVAQMTAGCANQQQSTAALNAVGQAMSTALMPSASPQPSASQSAPNLAPGPQRVVTAPPTQFKRFADTKLPGLLSNDPSSVNAREGFPKVALIPVYVPTFHNAQATTIAYGARGGCWIYRAKIWTSPKNSEDVAEFSYCMPSDIRAKPRSGVLKSDLELVTDLKCHDSGMPDNFTTTRKNGVGPRASYRLIPDEYLSKAGASPGSEQLYFMLNDLGISPHAGRQASCRAWIASSTWQAKDF